MRDDCCIAGPLGRCCYRHRLRSTAVPRSLSASVEVRSARRPTYLQQSLAPSIMGSGGEQADAKETAGAARNWLPPPLGVAIGFLDLQCVVWLGVVGRRGGWRRGRASDINVSHHTVVECRGIVFAGWKDRRGERNGYSVISHGRVDIDEAPLTPHNVQCQSGVLCLVLDRISHCLACYLPP